ncbi:MAG: hypothetical protein J6C61_05155 [Clostridia bacterium]|nr:hypothetical protein [Clostridia bacterium]
MLPYENVYSLENGRLIKNTENKIQYTDKNGKKRVKTNPTYKDFAGVGKYPLKNGSFGASFYEIKDGYIVAGEEKQ